MSLLIGQHIQETLAKDEAVKAKVGDRIYPVVAAQGAPSYPFVIYDSVCNGGEITKDGATDDMASVNVAAFGKSYGEAVMTAHRVKKVLESSSGLYPEFEVCEARFVQSEEDYNDDLQAYIINMNFEFITEEL